MGVPPGPKGNPIYGNIEAFEMDRLGFLERAKREYGDVVRYNKSIYILNHPDDVRFILDNTGKIFGITSDLFSRPVDEENLAGWMQFRKTVTSYTKRSNLAQFTPVITKVVDEALNTMKPGQHFKVLDLMEFMTSLSINLFVFGEAGRVVPEPASKLLDALLVMIGNPFAFPMWLPTLTNLRIRATKKLMETAIDKAMRVSDNETTLLYTLRHSEFADGVPSDDQIRNALMGTLLAAHRVPAAALAWVWYLLDRNPDILAMLQCEVDKVCLEELPSLLGRLRFTRAVVKEAMRLNDSRVQCTKRIQAAF